MTKYENLTHSHLNARVEGNKVASNVLGVLRGEVETALKGDPYANVDEVIEVSAKKMVKGLETVGGEQSEKEIKILQPYLPETLTEAQVIEQLSELGIEKLPNFGAKMGRAIGILGKKADGKLIKQVIQEHYS